MGNPQKARQCSTGEVRQSLELNSVQKSQCNCKDCDAKKCPHIKIKKHDCLHIANSNVGSSSSQSSSKHVRKKCPKQSDADNNMIKCPKADDMDDMMRLLDGIDQKDCCCEVVARAIANNPPHLALATLRESINEGQIISSNQPTADSKNTP